MKFQKGDKVLVTKTMELGVISHVDPTPTIWYQVQLQPDGESPYFSWHREYELAFPRNGLDFIFDYLEAKGL